MQRFLRQGEAIADLKIRIRELERVVREIQARLFHQA